MIAHVLTMPSRQDRMRGARDNLTAKGFVPEMITGVDKNDPLWKDRVQCREWEALKPGEICCAQGHYNILRTVAGRHLAYGLVVEDDIDMRATPFDVLGYINELEALPGGWDLAMLSFNPLGGKILFDEQSVWGMETTRSFDRVWQTEFGTHGYLISRRGAKYFLEEGLPIWTQIDCMFRYRARDIKAFHLRKPVAYVRECGSDTE